MRSLTLLLIIFIAVVSYSGNLFSDTPPLGSVRITDVSYSGAACPQNSVSHMLSPDGAALSLLFDDYLVEVESDRRDASATKSCEVLLTLQSPPGWEFGIFSVDIRGFAGFDPGTTGWQWAVYWLNGRGLSGVENDCKGNYGNYVACKQFYGPFDDNYIHSNTLSLNNIPFSSCIRTQHRIKIRTGAVVQTKEAGQRAAILTVDSMDGELRERYNLAWRQCNGGGVFTATCDVDLKNQWRTIRTFTSQGTGNSEVNARQHALNNAKAICESVRKSYPQYVCDVANARCTVTPQ